LTIAGNYFIFHFSRDTSILSDSVEVEFFGRWEALTFSSAELALRLGSFWEIARR
jgi:hypothetical protein